jgi:hypothetical protein
MEKKRTKRMRTFGWATLCFAISAFIWTGCTKAGSSSTTVSTVTYLSVIHGAPYTPAATVYLNDTLVTQTTGVATGAYSPKYGTIRPGNYGVKWKKAGSDSLLDQLSASKYDTLNFYTLLLYNDPQTKAAHALKIFDDYSGVSNNNNAYYRFFNLSPEYPAVNVYLNGVLSQSSRHPADNATSDLLNQFQPVQAGAYVVKVTDAKNDSLIVQTGTVNLLSGNPYTIWVTGVPSQKNMSINVFQAQF